MNKLPERLEELREEKGLSRNQLCKILKLGGGTVFRWEMGQSTPNADYIIMLCEFFDCSAGYLLGLENIRRR